MESIDDLLAQVKAEYQEKELGLQPKKQPLFQEEDLNSAPPVSSTYQSQPLQQNVLSSAEESLLAEVKSEFEAQDIAEELRQREQLKEEQRRKEQQLREEQLKAQQREKRKREALTREATEWLKNLNPHSEEGLWFEEFSYAYPSKLEAAIDYLQALRETHP
jgi:myo-inositol-1-phosphate synthase